MAVADRIGEAGRAVVVGIGREGDGRAAERHGAVGGVLYRGHSQRVAVRIGVVGKQHGRADVEGRILDGVAGEAAPFGDVAVVVADCRPGVVPQGRIVYGAPETVERDIVLIAAPVVRLADIPRRIAADERSGLGAGHPAEGAFNGGIRAAEPEELTGLAIGEVVQHEVLFRCTGQGQQIGPRRLASRTGNGVGPAHIAGDKLVVVTVGRIIDPAAAARGSRRQGQCIVHRHWRVVG